MVRRSITATCRQPVGPNQFSRTMGELGIEQIFARSPQAKGRVERMAGAFQDRLVSELRLAEASTLEQANVLLGDFLPRFNAQFRVPAQQDQAAYRPFAPSLRLERILCFKHLRQMDRDNTVKYQLRPLKLLPAQDRPSYAGIKVEVLERSDGQLMVQYGGEVIPHQEAPPKAGALRAAQGAMAPTPEMAQVVRNLSQNGLTRKQLQRLAALGTSADQPADDENEPTAAQRGNAAQAGLDQRQLALPAGTNYFAGLYLMISPSSSL